MNYERLTAGVFAGAGALFLIYKGEVQTGSLILMGMLAFFVGEKNGQRTLGQQTAKTTAA